MARLIEWNNQVFTVSSLLRELGISKTSFYRNVAKGLNEYDAIEKCLENMSLENS